MKALLNFDPKIVTALMVDVPDRPLTFMPFAALLDTVVLARLRPVTLVAWMPWDALASMVIQAKETFFAKTREMAPSLPAVPVEPVTTPPEPAVPVPVIANDPLLVLTDSSEMPRPAPVALALVSVITPDEPTRSTARAFVVVTDSWLTTTPFVPEATSPRLPLAGVRSNPRTTELLPRVTVPMSVRCVPLTAGRSTVPAGGLMFITVSKLVPVAAWDTSQLSSCRVTSPVTLPPLTKIR